MRLRVFGAIVFIIALAAIAAEVLVEALKESTTTGSPAALLVAQMTATSVSLGVPLAEPILVRAINARGFPMAGRDLTLSVERLSLTVSEALLCRQRGNDNLHSVMLSLPCDPVTVGAAATTDGDGIARFPDFAVRQGPPGLYTLAVRCEECVTVTGESLVTEFTVSFRSGVSALTVLNSEEGRAWNRSFVPGRPLPFQPQVLATDDSGLPVAGRVVTAAVVPDTSYINSQNNALLDTPSSLAQVRQDRVALLDGAVAVTGPDGVARFEELTVSAFSRPSVVIGITCEGAGGLLFNLDDLDPVRQARVVAEAARDGVTGGLGAALLLRVPVAVADEAASDPPPPAALPADPFAAAPPAEATEGVPFAAAVRLGADQAGRVVFAVPAAYEGRGLSPLFSNVRDPTHKTMLGAVSLPADAAGVARFENLRFSIGGVVGEYLVRFLCQGVAVAEANVTALTSVATVEVLVPEAWTAAAPTVGLFATTTNVAIMPFFRALDAQGRGVAGKKIEIYDTTGAHSLFIPIGADGRVGLDVTDDGGLAFATELVVTPARLRDEDLLSCTGQEGVNIDPCLYRVMRVGASVDGLSGSSNITVQVIDVGLSLRRGSTDPADVPTGLVGFLELESVSFVSGDGAGAPLPDGTAFDPPRRLAFEVRAWDLMGDAGSPPAGVEVCMQKASLTGLSDPLIRGGQFLTNDPAASGVLHVCTITDASGRARITGVVPGAFGELGVYWAVATNNASAASGDDATTALLQRLDLLPAQAFSPYFRLHANYLEDGVDLLSSPGGPPAPLDSPSVEVDPGDVALVATRSVNRPLPLVLPPYVLFQLIRVPTYLTAFEALRLPMFGASAPTELETADDTSAFGRFLTPGSADDGLTITNLTVVDGYPGVYGMVAVDVTTFSLTNYFEFIVGGAVASLEPVPGTVWGPSDADADLGGTVPVFAGATLPWQPLVRVLDEGGAPMPGYRVVAALHPNDTSVACLGGFTSSPSNASGVAAFDTLSLLHVRAESSAPLRVRFELLAQSDTVRSAYLTPLQAVQLSGVDIKASTRPPSVIPAGSVVKPAVRVAIRQLTVSRGSGRALPPTFDEPVTISAQRVDPETQLPDGSAPVNLGGSLVLPRPPLVPVAGTDETESSVRLQAELAGDADAPFVAVFDSLIVPGAVTPGTYRWTYALPGLEVDGGISRVETTVGALSIQREPEDAQVGGLQVSSVLVTTPGGVPFSNVLVTVSVSEGGGSCGASNCRAALVPSTAAAFTDGLGVATFNAVWLLGVSNTVHRLEYEAQGVTTVSAQFSLYNRVSSVEIVRQPGGTALASTSPSSGAASLAQPSVRVLAEDGLPVPNEEVIALLVPAGRSLFDPNFRFVAGGSRGALTGADGVAEFTELYVPANIPSGSYEMLFACLGVDSAASRRVSVSNPLEVDTSGLSNFSLLVYLAALSVLPVYLGNSGWHTARWSFVGFAVSVSLLISHAGTADKELNAPGGGDPYTKTLFSFSLAVYSALVLAAGYVALRVLLAARGRCGGIWRDHHSYRSESYRRVFSRAVRPTTPAAERQARLDAAVLLHERDAEKEAPWSSGLRRVAVCAGLARSPPPDTAAATQSWPLRSRRQRLRTLAAPFEGRDAFFYPQRVVFSYAAAATATLLAVLGALAMTGWLSTEVLKARSLLITVQFGTGVDLSEVASQVDPLQGGDASAAAVQDESSSDRFRTLLAATLNVLGGSDPSETEFVSRAVELAGTLAAVLAVAAVAASCAATLRQYRRDALDLRVGDYARLTGQRADRDSMEPVSAAYLPGVVIWRCTFGYFMAFFSLLPVLFVVQFEFFWDALLVQGRAVFIGLLSVTAAVSLFSAAMSKVTVSGGVVSHRRMFGVYEFVVLYLGVAAGIFSALSQFFEAIYHMVLRFPRVDLPWYPGDGSFESYASSLLLCHDTTSPAVQAAVEVLRHEVLLGRGGVAAATAAAAAAEAGKAPATATSSSGSLFEMRPAAAAPSRATRKSARKRRLPLSRARARLRVAVTLLCNPALRPQGRDGSRGREVDETQVYRQPLTTAGSAFGGGNGGDKDDDADDFGYEPAARLSMPFRKSSQAARRTTVATRGSRVSAPRGSVLSKPLLGTEQEEEDEAAAAPEEQKQGRDDTAASVPLPPGWTEHVDQSGSGLPYYHHPEHGTTWTRPA